MKLLLYNLNIIFPKELHFTTIILSKIPGPTLAQRKKEFQIQQKLYNIKIGQAKCCDRLVLVRV